MKLYSSVELMPNKTNMCARFTQLVKWTVVLNYDCHKVQAVDVRNTFKSKQTAVCTISRDSVISTVTSKFETHRFVYFSMCYSKVTFPFQVDWCSSNALRLVLQSPVENSQVTNHLKTDPHWSPSSPQENADYLHICICNLFNNTVKRTALNGRSNVE